MKWPKGCYVLSFSSLRSWNGVEHSLLFRHILFHPSNGTMFILTHHATFPSTSKKDHNMLNWPGIDRKVFNCHVILHYSNILTNCCWSQNIRMSDVAFYRPDHVCLLLRFFFFFSQWSFFSLPWLKCRLVFWSVFGRNQRFDQIYQRKDCFKTNLKSDTAARINTKHLLFLLGKKLLHWIRNLVTNKKSIFQRTSF